MASALGRSAPTPLPAAAPRCATAAPPAWRLMPPQPLRGQPLCAAAPLCPHLPRTSWVCGSWLSSRGQQQGRPLFTTPKCSSSSGSGTSTSKGGGCPSARKRNAVIGAAARAKAEAESQYTLQHVLDKMRPHFDLGGVSEVEVTGKGKHLGVPVDWSIQFSAGGAFHEAVSSTYLNYRWSFDGHPASRCVEVDGSGAARQLDLDDHEMLLLGMLLRTGLWTREDVAGRLGLERWLVPLEVGVQEPVKVLPIFTRHSVYPVEEGPPTIYLAAMAPPEPSSSPSTSSSAAAAAGGRSGDSSSSGSRPPSRRGRTSSRQSSSSSGGGVSGSAGGSSRSGGKPPGNAPQVGICFRLNAGRMIVRLRVCTRTWLPLSYSQSLCGAGELWRYEEWDRAATWDERQGSRRPTGLPPGYHWPRKFAHNVPGGGDYCYEARTIQVARQPGASRYSRPQWCEELSDTVRLLPGQGCIPFSCSSAEGVGVAGTPPRPAAVTVAASVAAASPAMTVSMGGLEAGEGVLGEGVVRRVVPAYRTPMGHTLLQVSINAQPPAWFILDSGASGFVVNDRAPHVLVQVLEGDGAQVAGISGKTTTSFCFADSIEVGGWRLQRQSLMVMDISHIGTHTQQALAGIAGYELFRRLVVVTPSKWQREEQAKVAARLLEGCDDPEPVLTHMTSGSSSTSSSSSSSTPGAHSSKRRRTTTSSSSSAAATATATPSSSSGSGGSAGAPLGHQQRLAEEAARVSAVSSGHEAAGDALRQGASAPTAATTTSSSKKQQQQQPSSGATTPSTSTSNRRSSSISSSSSSQKVTKAAAPGGGGKQTPPSSPLLLELNHPRYVPSYTGITWVPIHLVSGLPHIPVSFTTPKGKVVSCLLMVDTGAGGVEVMLHTRAAKELGLGLTNRDGKPTRFITGVGHSGASNQTYEVTLPWLQLGARAQAEDGRRADANWAAAQAGQGQVLRLNKVKALYTTSGGLDISLYSAGIICGELLDRMQVVFDYPRQRLGFRAEGGGAAGPAGAAIDVVGVVEEGTAAA